MPGSLISPSEIRGSNGNDKPTRGGSFALFALGFRPFFLGAMVSAPVLICLWICVLTGLLPVQLPGYGPIGWHAHEMLFGFVGAAIAGFILTASANWTGIRTLHGWPLVLVFVVWLLARLLPWTPLQANTWLMSANVGFWGLLGLAYLPPILRSRNYRNLVFVPILALLGTATALVHGAGDGSGPGPAEGWRLGVFTVVILMSLVGGRVIPFFTERAAPLAEPRRLAPLELLVPVLTIVAGAVAVGGPGTSRSAAILFLVTALVQATRLGAWFGRPVLRIPLLWILYVGYAWIPVGFVLLALHEWGLAPYSAAIHAFTAGAMGSLVAGIIPRVTRGHTGRLLQADRWTTLAFCLVVLAGLGRVVGALGGPTWHLHATAALWILAWTILAIVYVPMLVRPRIDGRAW